MCIKRCAYLCFVIASVGQSRSGGVGSLHAQDAIGLVVWVAGFALEVRVCGRAQLIRWVRFHHVVVQQHCCIQQYLPECVWFRSLIMPVGILLILCFHLAVVWVVFDYVRSTLGVWLYFRVR